MVNVRLDRWYLSLHYPFLKLPLLMCLSNRLSEQMYFGWEASSSGISWNPRSRFSQPIIFSLLSPNFKKKVPKWQEMIDHSISITTVTMTLTTVTMTLTKVGGDEEGLIELLNYNMELGRMVTTMAKNVFWVRTCSQRWLMFLQWLKKRSSEYGLGINVYCDRISK